VLGVTGGQVATYDIFPTVLTLAGVPMPNVVLDGIDISSLLLSKAPESEAAHKCIMFYKHPESQLGAAGAAQLDSLSAVR
jgi:arylsulfatase A-like enzyme